jgi:universal stress protein E
VCGSSAPTSIWPCFSRPISSSVGRCTFTFGPLDRTLVRHSHVPVLIVKPQPNRSPRVLIALDVNNPGHDQANDYLMELALSQAQLSGAELHVAHAWELVGETALRSGAFTAVSAEEIDALKAEERDARHRALQALFARHSDASIKMVEHLVEGPHALALNAVAKAVQPHLMVMGVTPRRRLASLVLNDLAEAMLGSLDCSLLLVNVTVVAGANKP